MNEVPRRQILRRGSSEWSPAKRLDPCRDTRGATFVEYIVLVGVVALAGLAGFQVFGKALLGKAGQHAACAASLDCGDASAEQPSAPPPVQESGVSGSGAPAGSEPAPSRSRVGSLVRGFGSEAWDTLSGAYELFYAATFEGSMQYALSGRPNPLVQTAAGLGKILASATTPGRIVAALGGPDPLGDAIAGAKARFQDGLRRDKWEMGGRVAFEVAALALPFAKVRMLGRAAELSEVARAGDLENGVRAVADSVRVGEADAVEFCPGGVCRGGGMCFAAGTPIRVAHGAPKPIEQIAEGDTVMARDPETGATRAERVVRRFVTPNRPVVSLALTDEQGSVEPFTVTAEHPFWVEGKGFRPVAELAPGDRIRTLEGHADVTAVASLPDTMAVYNFEVEHAHTYFVGTIAAWVHNSCDGVQRWGNAGRDAVRDVADEDRAASAARANERAAEANLAQRYRAAFERVYGRQPGPGELNDAAAVKEMRNPTRKAAGEVTNDPALERARLDEINRRAEETARIGEARAQLERDIQADRATFQQEMDALGDRATPSQLRPVQERQAARVKLTQQREAELRARAAANRPPPPGAPR